jgi:hypothetical protein
MAEVRTNPQLIIIKSPVNAGDPAKQIVVCQINWPQKISAFAGMTNREKFDFLRIHQ